MGEFEGLVRIGLGQAQPDGGETLGGNSRSLGGLRLFERGIGIGLEQVFKQDRLHFPPCLAGGCLFGQAFERVWLGFAHGLDQQLHRILGAAVIAGNGGLVFLDPVIGGPWVLADQGAENPRVEVVAVFFQELEDFLRLVGVVPLGQAAQRVVASGFGDLVEMRAQPVALELADAPGHVVHAVLVGGDRGAE